MENSSPVLSKVLVHEFDPLARQGLKKFCRENRLIGLRESSIDVLSVLRKNIDLGAVFISEKQETNGSDGIELGMRIHELRHELPIFLRREKNATLDDLPEEVQRAFAGAYVGEQPEQLEALVEEYIFNVHYPNNLVESIREISESAISSQLTNMAVFCDVPYLVKDRLTYGELFSLIPLESTWCRGYMMLQIEEAPLSHMISQGRTSLSTESLDFRSLNEWLGEVTNLIWGGFKNRYGLGVSSQNDVRTQVPIINNHVRGYISFGTAMPQLVFKYSLRDLGGLNKDFYLYQKFIFHLNWSPEEIAANQETLDQCIESGDLEFF